MSTLHTARRSIAAEHKRIDRTYYAALSKLARRIGREIVAPLCRHHRLTFTGGMGVYCIDTHDGVQLTDAATAKRYGYNLKRLFAVLDEQMLNGYPIGSIVPDYPPAKRLA